MLRVRAVVLAAVLILMAPLARLGPRPRGVVGAGLQPPRRTRRSGRLSPPSSSIAASRSSSFSMNSRGSQPQSRGHWTRANRPTSRSARSFPLHPEMGSDDRLVDLTDTIGSFSTCSIPTRSPGTRYSTRRPARRRCTPCRWTRPTMSTSGATCWSRRGSPSRTSRRSGVRSGHSGAIGSSRRYARPPAATTSGALASTCRARPPTLSISSSNSWLPTTRTMWPGWPTRH